MGIYYAQGTQLRVIDRLGGMSKDELWGLIDLVGIPTDDRPPAADWEHKELRQRITDWFYADVFAVTPFESAEPAETEDELSATARLITEDAAKYGPSQLRAEKAIRQMLAKT